MQVCEICGKESENPVPYNDTDKRLHCAECGEKRATEEEAAETSVEKAAKAVKKRFDRIVMIARMGKSLDLQKQKLVEMYPPEERGAVLAFTEWCAGEKFEGGIRAKIAAKMGFVWGYRIAKAVYGPTAEQEEARSKLVVP